MLFFRIESEKMQKKIGKFSLTQRFSMSSTEDMYLQRKKKLT
jgi:hypothetical protein